MPRPAWTHEAHLAACAYLLLRRPDIDLDRDIGHIIAAYNASVGGVNDDHGGYHDTITRASLAGVRSFLRGRGGEALVDTVNALLASDFGRRDWPLQFYSTKRLFSLAARRGFVEPDILPLPVTKARGR